MKNIAISAILSLLFTHYAFSQVPKPSDISVASRFSSINKKMDEGFVLTSWWNTDYQGSQIDVTLDRMKGRSAESVAILTTWYQDDKSSTEIYRWEQKTPQDSGVAMVTSKAKQRNLKTVLKPHVDIKAQNQWRGEIIFDNEADWQAWFSSYNAFITHYASLAQDNNIDCLVIGTELKGTTHRPEWRQIIQNVRSLYAGEIVYAANHDNYQNVMFWDDLDYIGIDAYFQLTEEKDPTLDELVASLNSIYLDIEAFSNLQGKKVIFTEVGYQDCDGTNITPWGVNGSCYPGEDEQADCYRAFLHTFYNKDFVKGIYWWQVYHNLTDPDRFTFIDKDAEGVIDEFYRLPMPAK